MDKLLVNLINAFGISGNEKDIRELIKQQLGKHDFSIHEDKIGNLVVKVGSAKKKVMICSHMDSIGFIVNHIEKNGVIRVESIGNFNSEDVSHSFIRFENGTLGKVFKSKEGIFADIGVDNKEDVLKKLKEGDTASLTGPYLSVGNDIIISPLLHNKCGCYILLRLIQEIKNKDTEFYFVFSSQGEVGGIGARAAADYIYPDYCLIIGTERAKGADGTGTNISLGKGPVLKIMDKSLIMHEDIKNMLENAANKAKIKLQYSISTDKSEGGLIHKEKIGIRTGEIAIPCRYKYSTSEMMSLNDIEDIIKVLKEIV